MAEVEVEEIQGGWRVVAGQKDGVDIVVEATGVRFPARVETRAKESQDRCGSAIFGIQWAASRTNGTLLTSWQAATVKAPNRNVCCTASTPKAGASTS